jgi:hypothetical protein
MPHHALVFGPLLLPVGGIEQEIERDLECIRHLMRIKHQREGRRHDADHRRDGKSSPRHVMIELPDRLDMAARHADFLLGLAQRRGDGIDIVILDPPAGKCDLTGMPRQMVGPFCEQDGNAVRPIYQGHQHGGGAQLRQRRHAGVEVVIAPPRAPAAIGTAHPARQARANLGEGWSGARLCRRQFDMSAGGSVPSGKKIRSLHTPSSIPCSVARSTASSTSS